MHQLPPALPHGELKEVFPDVFFVTGAMQTELMNVPWEFSRNMTVVREGNALTLINAIRLDDVGIKKLEALGRVANVVQIGCWHRRDTQYYLANYGAPFWALAGIPDETGLTPDKRLSPGGEMPFAGCTVFDFRTTKLPEGVLHINREGGILVSANSLQNYLAPDEYFSDDTRKMMMDMNFFECANVGPLWRQLNEPQAQDFVRLLELQFRHLLPGHGSPLPDKAKEAFTERFRRMFSV